MKTIGSEKRGGFVPTLSLLPYLFITFGLAWGILALYIFLPGPMTEMFGQLTGQHPLFFLAVWSPGIAAVIIVTLRGGVAGLKSYFGRLLLWRCSRAWWAFLMLGIPLVFYVGSALKGNLFAQPFPYSSLPALIGGLLLTAVKGPVEEFGWRGLALPLLQRKLAPFWAGLLLGVIWGFWHLPAFLLGTTPQSAWAFGPFFAGSIALSVLVTPLFNASRGSILLPAFFHFMLNNPVWPDAQPYDTYLLVPAAILVVWFNRETMFTRQGAVRDVIPEDVSPVVNTVVRSGPETPASLEAI